MYKQLIIWFHLILAVAVSAVPHNRHRLKSGSFAESFKLDRVTNPKYSRNITAAVAKAAYKFGGSNLPAAKAVNDVEIHGAARTAEDFTVGSTSPGNVIGNVQNTPYGAGDIEYLVPVTIGGQAILMDIDTGSSDFWVFNTHLPSSQSAGHTPYDPTKSSTFQKLTGETFNINYGGGTGASGFVGTDSVNIGGAIVNAQAIELPTTLANNFVSDTSNNGIVGFGFSNANQVHPTQQNTFLDNLKSSLQQPVFTANLKHATTGSYEIGAIDSTQFVAPVSYIPVKSTSGYWMFECNSFAVGSGSKQDNTESQPAIADTGTSMLFVDESIATAYYAQVTGAEVSANNQWVFPCTSHLPDLHLWLGPNYSAKIPGSLINYQQLSDDCKY